MSDLLTAVGSFLYSFSTTYIWKQSLANVLVFISLEPELYPLPGTYSLILKSNKGLSCWRLRGCVNILASGELEEGDFGTVFRPLSA